MQEILTGQNKPVLINQSDSKNKRKMSKEKNSCKRKNLYCYTGPKSEAHLTLQPFSFTAGKEWFGAQVSRGAAEGTGIVQTGEEKAKERPYHSLQ